MTGGIVLLVSQVMGHLALQSAFEQSLAELVKQAIGTQEGFGRAVPFEQLVEGCRRKYKRLRLWRFDG